MTILIISVLAAWFLLELIVRLYVELPLKTDFYGSLPQALVAERQAQYQVQVAIGLGWAHLGWIADPQRESYRIEKQAAGGWVTVGHTRFGSFLVREAGLYQVWAVPRGDGSARLVGQANAAPQAGSSPLFIPRIAGEWQPVFRPQVSGYYINDHTICQDAAGEWRLVGITSKTQGDFDAERYFATASSHSFPPPDGMREGEPVADFGELAWAPHVLKQGSVYHMFWSPHQLHQMTSPDGVTWDDHRVTMATPFHKFFRDPMVIQVAEGQWLLYTTARSRYYSMVDVYQSFNLQEWQYIRSVLRSSWGSERNSPFASTESPSVIQYQGHYYLSLTYNNDSYFWPGILLLLKIWPNPASYNDTLVFHSDNPYDFGDYRGQKNAPTLLARLEAHAPEFVYDLHSNTWYVTTAGWPWVASLTSGEVAAAPLVWEPID